MSAELPYQIAMTMIRGLGDITARGLLAKLGSPEAFFKEKSSILNKLVNHGDLLADDSVRTEALKRAEKEIKFIENHHINTYFFTKKDYPYRLKECNDAPLMLYSKGDKDLNSGHFISIVGTRKATPYGKQMCEQIIADLAISQPQLTIVSGLAYGIDVCAHKAALKNKVRTFGVVAHGLDTLYPQNHRSIAVKMVENNGGIITEFPSGTKLDPAYFVKRNRIIAGLCDMTLVVESAIKGGALITAKLANDYNRDVFAVPGRIGEEYSAGCNYLIKTNQAVLAESASDIEKFMGWESKGKATQQVLFYDLTEEEKLIIENLRKETLHINVLSKVIDLPVQKTMSLLVQIEFKGLVTSLPGNMFMAK